MLSLIFGLTSHTVQTSPLKRSIHPSPCLFLASTTLLTEDTSPQHTDSVPCLGQPPHPNPHTALWPMPVLLPLSQSGSTRLLMMLFKKLVTSGQQVSKSCTLGRIPLSAQLLGMKLQSQVWSKRNHASLKHSASFCLRDTQILCWRLTTGQMTQPVCPTCFSTGSFKPQVLQTV